MAWYRETFLNENRGHYKVIATLPPEHHQDCAFLAFSLHNIILRDKNSKQHQLLSLNLSLWFTHVAPQPLCTHRQRFPLPTGCQSVSQGATAGWNSALTTSDKKVLLAITCWERNSENNDNFHSYLVNWISWSICSALFWGVFALHISEMVRDRNKCASSF